jgi:hypothetical protein
VFQDPINKFDLNGQCWGCGMFKKVVHAAKKAIQVVTHHTVGFCVTGSAGAGPFGSASGCIALSGGHPTFIGSLGGGGSSPTASLTGGLLISNARNRKQLDGPFGFAGGSADLGASVGDNFSFGNDSQNQSIWENETSAGLGVDLPIPFEFHGGASYTWTGGF